ncbi:hypothetical protein ACFL2J_06110 [Candidatus Omnitrophota bacterium]
MLIKLIGWFWLITGILFLIWPQMLRNRLQKKTYKQIRRLLFILAIFIGALLFSAGFRAEGFKAKLLMIIGVIGLLKALLFLKAKAAEKILNWFLKQRLSFFRFCACIQIVIGAVILLA